MTFSVTSTHCGIRGCRAKAAHTVVLLLAEGDLHEMKTGKVRLCTRHLHQWEDDDSRHPERARRVLGVLP